MAFSDPVIIGANSYARLSDGLYRFTGGSADEPQDLIFKNSLNPDGISSFLIEYRKLKNSSTPGGKDDMLRFMTQVKYPTKAFSATEVKAIDGYINTLLTSAIWDRILLGER